MRRALTELAGWSGAQTANSSSACCLRCEPSTLSAARDRSTGVPVTLPTPWEQPGGTARQGAVRALLEEGLSLSREREALLAGLRARAEEALSRGEEAPADAAALLAPLVREGRSLCA